MTTVFRKLDDAVDELRRDPTRPVRADVGDMEVELRAVPPAPARFRLGDLLASLGPWEGEDAASLMQRLAEARQLGGSGEAPHL